MPFGLPNVSFVGYPVAVPCPPHAGLGVRQVARADEEAVVAHFLALEPGDRRMRFCATLNDEAIRRHVQGLWARPGLVIAAIDGPLWRGPLHKAGPIRALAEVLLTAPGEAELGISVDSHLRRRGIGTYLVQAAASLLAPRGVRTIRASTLPGNASFVAMARACDAEVTVGFDQVEVAFDIGQLDRAYRRRRAAAMLSCAN